MPDPLVVNLVALPSSNPDVDVWSASAKWPDLTLGTNRCLPAGSTPKVYVWRSGDNCVVDIIKDPDA